MTRNRRRVVFAFVAVVALVVCGIAVASFQLNRIQGDRVAHSEKIIRKTRYIGQFDFHFNHSLYEGLNNASPEEAASRYSDVVFVFGESESRMLPQDVIVGWPSENTKLVLDRFNWYLRVHNVDLVRSRVDRLGGIGDYEAGSLAFPLTMKDLVTKWDAVQRLLGSMESADYITNG